MTEIVREDLIRKQSVSSSGDEWTQEEIDILYWYYNVQRKMLTDVVGQIIKFFSDSGYTAKSRFAVIQQLLEQVRFASSIDLVKKIYIYSNFLIGHNLHNRIQ